MTPNYPGQQSGAITIVSGLPRSGTSMMMQMLAAAGLRLHSDGSREPDEHNPRGYLEHEAVRRLGTDASWLSEARGRALKVVAPLLPDLPADQSYRVIWMVRDLDEVLASQQRMITSSGGAVSPEDDAPLRRAFERQLAEARAGLDRRNVPTLEVSYAHVVEEPDRASRQVCEFLGGDLDATAAATAVDPTLYRTRRS